MKEALKTILEIQELDMKMLRLMRVKKERVKEIEQIEALRKRVEAKKLFFTYEIFNTYTAMMLLADAIERAKSGDRAAITSALETSTFSDHFMPYGPTKFVNGQNTGAQPLMTQVLKNDIKVIVPREYREIDPVFPLRA